MPEPSRRDFLKLATTGLLSAAGLLGLAGLAKFFDFETEPPKKTVFDVGEAARYPTGSRMVLSEVPAVLFSTASGFQAISLVCTHLGCTVEADAGGFKCPCHGSRYDGEGNLERGPARLPLKQLRVEVTSAGHVLIHTDGT